MSTGLVDDRNDGTCLSDDAVLAPSASRESPGEGVFLSFEGGDGAGKSTQVALLAEALRQAGHEVVVTREPGGTPLGEAVRDLLLHGAAMSERAEALLYAADRAQHVAEVVRPALARGAVVVTDRYLDSSVAYQAGGRELSAHEVEGISLWATAQLLPRLTVLLDIEPGQAARRRGPETDRLERAGNEFHRRTSEAFRARAAADPARWAVIDAGGSKTEVAATIRRLVRDRVGLLGEEP